VPAEPDIHEVAAAIQVSVGLLRRRLQQAQVAGDLSASEISALARLDRGGPTTPSALAKLEGITPQSMGATLGGLERRGLVARRPDPDDGRHVVLSVTELGLELLRTRRSARTEQLATALSGGFNRAELATLRSAAPLIERLAQNL
jgi:DNA-binding MarR family transcriptional regulator